MRALYDTNILIDFLRGVDDARASLEAYPKQFISRITWMEVMVGARDASEYRNLMQFLQLFTVVELDECIAADAISLRKKYTLRLPDALIWASARSIEALFLTRDAKDFPVEEVKTITLPYTLCEV